MASSSDQEGKITETMAENTPAKQDDVEEAKENCSGSPETSNDGISMFCKACLHPYSGERKTGSLVLKCERCGQTDVVLEEEAPDLNPEEWVGNLMMNRFMQVLKEQEDLGLNISDPFFAEDEYQRLHLAISEYTFNMKAVAERMYDIANKAASSLADYYENEAKKRQEKGEMAKEADEQAEVVYVLPESVRRHLKNLGPTVLTLMEDLIKKYELSMEILEKVKERVQNAKEKSEEEKEVQRKELENFKSGIGEAEDSAEAIKELGKGKSDGATAAEPEAVAKEEAGQDESEEGKKNEDKEYKLFNVSRSLLEREVFDALQHKFALRFECEGDDTSSKNDKGETEIGDGAVASAEPEKPKPNFDSDAKEAHVVLESVEGLRTFVLETTSDDPQSVANVKEEEPVLEVNFYVASSAFINELQERKGKALLERKDSALATVHQKIRNLKKEVERVEDRVREELTAAYEKKRKKVENQRRQLDERHHQIQEAERLLDFYARTGQTDKLAELMEQLNVQYEN